MTSNLDKLCQHCGEGRYQECSLYDDWNHTLTCPMCKHVVPHNEPNTTKEEE